ncbi:hypothetical protein Pmani_027183 [Petrolisthes manimaculis]|uniref:Chitin-binding type-2 domain-containing protein n=1 Tax=Petrolisthes manimaculis TaxID=1843537 RepID=A0AAE1P450_9EUCA|nr:hypothetical protein Pmani_027183 [Petrolisthes manimaculis]
MGAVTPFPQGPSQYSRSSQVYQDEPRYTGPAPQADQYQPEAPKYQKKYQDIEEEDEDYDNVNAIPGEPGKDYPVLGFIPITGFSCSEKLPGFYADEKANCQVWHYCKTDGLMESFLCPNGTIYNQGNRVCEWWFNVKCDAETLSLQARVNEDLYIVPSPKPESKYTKDSPKYAPAQPKYAPARPQYSPVDPAQYSPVDPAQYSPIEQQQQYQYSPDQSVF